MPSDTLYLDHSKLLFWEGLSRLVENEVPIQWNNYLISRHCGSENAFIHFVRVPLQTHRSSDTFQKLHVAFDSALQVQSGLNAILQILSQEKIDEFKIILFSKYNEIMQGDQAGKVFTIYFNEHTIKKIDDVAKKMEAALKNIADLQKPTKTAAQSVNRPDHAISDCDFVTKAFARNNRTYCVRLPSVVSVSETPSRSGSALTNSPLSPVNSADQLSFWYQTPTPPPPPAALAPKKPSGSCYGQFLTSFRRPDSHHATPDTTVRSPLAESLTSLPSNRP
ncbi:MAG: hypothetical protein A3I77_07670 [Gammaproteobacteria bacterium RIFCSPLOWO2_02_FULL_42_14]|nr:MAG: hypothetical protein A3B71_03500 [Gammaproteobacteria bacterium RIFCSPHIGHO2_02_FULL_42_43]OGT27440.1 MAG: hypothetical protein A2624_06295 [Gammaproteobacteria bacterium RIFCSPHIGHO2_01_FULL_42_8]OGT53006.1 MAG: hypothetical protein A3E54_08025 [Gammaproteobacteria bacterium RIFCSPHIGHO2_12_FULL_41_25]OGT61222.1 MAG: hypothetical protein A3I77_07670 [Gammaproteobacteria bacterium RIFCSPLOWO2_02_FULL_42_14]OGT87149.1 MAG: hypothetical protein A3G86_01390 [Gammaproteobacteria bacterium R